MVAGLHPSGEGSRAPSVSDPLLVDSFAGRIEVRWAPDEAVTALGQLSFFVDFLKQSGLFEGLVAGAPLQYSSPNAPDVRDVMGTLVLSIVSGAKRYAHVNALRHDGVTPALPGMSRVCSDDSVRGAGGGGRGVAGVLSGLRCASVDAGAMDVDIDTTVKLSVRGPGKEHEAQPEAG